MAIFNPLLARVRASSLPYPHCKAPAVDAHGAPHEPLLRRQPCSGASLQTRGRAAWRLVALIAISVVAALSGSAPPRTVRPARMPTQFVRMQYTGTSLVRRPRALADPTSAVRPSTHLIRGIKRLTRIDTAEEGHYLGIMDDTLFDYPWIYAVEVGHWALTDEEISRLREYLLRGGFLMVDDFPRQSGMGRLHSRACIAFSRTAPSSTCRPTTAVFHVAYDTATSTCRFPAFNRCTAAVTTRSDGFTPHWRGIYDDDGRLMVVINFNMDLGDAVGTRRRALNTRCYTRRALTNTRSTIFCTR